MRKHLLFVYGSLKHGFGRHKTLSGAVFIGTATTDKNYAIYQISGYPAMIDEKHQQGPVRGAGRHIWGELYEVDESILIECDMVEGVSQGLFERREVELSEIHPTGLPQTQETYSDFHKKRAQAYFFKKQVGGAKDCGSFWSLR